MEVLTEKEEGNRQIEAYFPAPILHRLDADDDRWTRFYIEVPAQRFGYEWTDIAADFARLGFTKISSNATRELTGRELASALTESDPPVLAKNDPPEAKLNLPLL